MPAEIVKKYEDAWGDDPSSLLADYVYQPELTQKLDALSPNELNVEVFYEIVLWKLNRFPQINDDLLKDLRGVSAIEPKEHRKVKPTLRKMLQCHGIALPMASTILRFLKPTTFQIIDDRVYRIVHPGKAKYPAKPARLNEQYLANSETIYFEYLDELHNLACHKLPFSSADRIFYALDIKLGNKIGDET